MKLTRSRRAPRRSARSAASSPTRALPDTNTATNTGKNVNTSTKPDSKQRHSQQKDPDPTENAATENETDLAPAQDNANANTIDAPSTSSAGKPCAKRRSKRSKRPPPIAKSSKQRSMISFLKKRNKEQNVESDNNDNTNASGESSDAGEGQDPQEAYVKKLRMKAVDSSSPPPDQKSATGDNHQGPGSNDTNEIPCTTSTESSSPTLPESSKSILPQGNPSTDDVPGNQEVEENNEMHAPLAKEGDESLSNNDTKDSEEPPANALDLLANKHETNIVEGSKTPASSSTNKTLPRKKQNKLHGDGSRNDEPQTTMGEVETPHSRSYSFRQTILNGETETKSIGNTDSAVRPPTTNEIFADDSTTCNHEPDATGSCNKPDTNANGRIRNTKHHHDALSSLLLLSGLASTDKSTTIPDDDDGSHALRATSNEKPEDIARLDDKTNVVVAAAVVDDGNHDAVTVSVVPLVKRPSSPTALTINKATIISEGHQLSSMEIGDKKVFNDASVPDCAAAGDTGGKMEYETEGCIASLVISSQLPAAVTKVLSEQSAVSNTNDDSDTAIEKNGSAESHDYNRQHKEKLTLTEGGESDAVQNQDTIENKGIITSNEIQATATVERADESVAKPAPRIIAVEQGKVRTDIIDRKGKHGDLENGIVTGRSVIDPKKENDAARVLLEENTSTGRSPTNYKDKIDTMPELPEGGMVDAQNPINADDKAEALAPSPAHVEEIVADLGNSNDPNDQAARVLISPKDEMADIVKSPVVFNANGHRGQVPETADPNILDDSNPQCQIDAIQTIAKEEKADVNNLTESSAKDQADTVMMLLEKEKADVHNPMDTNANDETDVAHVLSTEATMDVEIGDNGDEPSEEISVGNPSTNEGVDGRSESEGPTDMDISPSIQVSDTCISEQSQSPGAKKLPTHDQVQGTIGQKHKLDKSVEADGKKISQDSPQKAKQCTLNLSESHKFENKLQEIDKPRSESVPSLTCFDMQGESTAALVSDLAVPQQSQPKKKHTIPSIEYSPQALCALHSRFPSLQQMKLQLYIAGAKVHRGRGAERRFADYWDALCRYVAFQLNETNENGINGLSRARDTLQLYLKTKQLRKLHNSLILAIIELCHKDFVQDKDLQRHIPSHWRKRTRVAPATTQPVEAFPTEEVQIQGSKSMVKPFVQYRGRNLPAIQRWKCLFGAHSDAWSASALSNPALHTLPVSDSEASSLAFDSNKSFSTEVPNSSVHPVRLPGAVTIDPTVRRIIDSEGLKVSESAVWLMVIAVREYAKSIVKNTISNIEALRNDQILPAQLTLRSSVFSAKRCPKRNTARKSSAIATEESNAPTGAFDSSLQIPVQSTGKRRCINSLDITSFLSIAPVSGVSSLGGTTSILAYERCNVSSFDTGTLMSQRDFHVVYGFIASGMGEAKRQRLENAPIVDSGCEPKSELTISVPEVLRLPVRGLGRGAKNLAALRARAVGGADTPSTPIPNTLEETVKGTSTTVVQQEEVGATPAIVSEKHASAAPPNAAALSEVQVPTVVTDLENHGVSKEEIPNEVEEETESTSSKLMDNDSVSEEVGSADGRGGGRGVGVKNLAGRGFGRKNLGAMRARTSQTNLAEYGKEESVPTGSVPDNDTTISSVPNEPGDAQLKDIGLPAHVTDPSATKNESLKGSDLMGEQKAKQAVDEPIKAVSERVHVDPIDLPTSDPLPVKAEVPPDDLDGTDS